MQYDAEIKEIVSGYMVSTSDEKLTSFPTESSTGRY